MAGVYYTLKDQEGAIYYSADKDESYLHPEAEIVSKANAKKIFIELQNEMLSQLDEEARKNYRPASFPGEIVTGIGDLDEKFLIQDDNFESVGDRERKENISSEEEEKK